MKIFNKAKQLKFRKDQGRVETKKEIIERLKKTNEVKNELKKKIQIDKNEFKFKMYRNNAKRKADLHKKAHFKIEEINYEIKKLQTKIENEFIAIEHKNKKVIYAENEIKEVTVESKRELEGREKEMRSRLDEFKQKKREIEKFL